MACQALGPRVVLLSGTAACRAIGVRILVSAMIACSSATIAVEASEVAHVLGPGWQCFLSPSGFDTPGSVFRIDSKRVKYTVRSKERIDSELGTKLIVDIRPVSIGRITFESERSVAFAIIAALQRLGISQPVDVGVSGQAERKSASAFELRATTQEVLDDAGAAQVVRWFGPSVDRLVNSRYFIVREAVAAGGVTYMMDNRTLKALAVEATFATAAKASPNIRVLTKGAYSLETNYEKPLRVCIKPEELRQRPSSLSGNITFELRKIAQPLRIDSEGASDTE